MRHTILSILYFQILAALEAEREAREMYQIKLEDSIRSDTDEDNCDIPTKMMGSPQMVKVVVFHIVKSAGPVDPRSKNIVFLFCGAH